MPNSIIVTLPTKITIPFQLQTKHENRNSPPHFLLWKRNSTTNSSNQNVISVRTTIPDILTWHHYYHLLQDLEHYRTRENIKYFFRKRKKQTFHWWI